MNTSELILPSHLARRAAVYIRQSTAQQVTTNQESLGLQYALTHRAQQLGWPESLVDVVDADLGRSGATTEGRVGFQELVAQVALGQIGILIAYDATRLARNCSHWYQLLDLCGRANCLIADRDSVYDPSSVNGRLLLGLKGQISELELHTIRARLTAGIRNKAQRGELAVMLPTGLERSAAGEVVKTPDRVLRPLRSQDDGDLQGQASLQLRPAAGDRGGIPSASSSGRIPSIAQSCRASLKPSRWPTSISQPARSERRISGATTCSKLRRSRSNGCGMRPIWQTASSVAAIPTTGSSPRNWSGAGNPHCANCAVPKRPWPFDDRMSKRGPFPLTCWRCSITSDHGCLNSGTSLSYRGRKRSRCCAAWWRKLF